MQLLHCSGLSSRSSGCDAAYVQFMLDSFSTRAVLLVVPTADGRHSVQGLKVQGMMHHRYDSMLEGNMDM
jgi:hypothetical protein